MRLIYWKSENFTILLRWKEMYFELNELVNYICKKNEIVFRIKLVNFVTF